MSELNYYRLAQLLGGKLTKTEPAEFGGFSTTVAAANRFRCLVDGPDAKAKDSVPPVQFADLAAAFEKVRQGYEVDRVLVDPKLRRDLLAETERRGITASPRAIFKRLQAFRKSSSFGIKLSRTTRAAGIDPEPFFYAAELGYVQLSYTRDASVDDVITVPEIGEEFDEVCRILAPHGSSMQYRWAALRLRKMRSFTEERIQSLLSIAPSKIEQKLQHSMRLVDLKPEQLPDEQGIFSFTEDDAEHRYLYVGSSRSVRAGVQPFQDAKPFRLIAGEYWRPDPERIRLRYGVVKKKWMGASARELGLRLIRDRQPLFNLPVELEKAA